MTEGSMIFQLDFSVCYGVLKYYVSIYVDTADRGGGQVNKLDLCSGTPRNTKLVLAITKFYSSILKTG